MCDTMSLERMARLAALRSVEHPSTPFVPSSPAPIFHPFPNLPSFDTHDTEKTGLAGNVLGSPSEVSGVKTEGTVLGVSTTGADGVDTLGGVKLGHGGLATELEFPLLAVLGAASAGRGALVATVTSDTHSGVVSDLLVVVRLFYATHFVAGWKEESAPLVV